MSNMKFTKRRAVQLPAMEPKDNFATLTQLAIKFQWTKHLALLQNLNIKKPSDVVGSRSLQSCLMPAEDKRVILQSCCNACNLPFPEFTDNEPLQTVQRPDFPVTYTAQTRGNQHQALLAASTPYSRSTALERLERDEYANTSRQPRASLWNTWCRIASAWQLDPLPLCPTLVRAVGASLKQGKYKSAKEYFARARQEHVKQLDFYPSAATVACIQSTVRSIERGLGGASPKEGFAIELLATAVPELSLEPKTTTATARVATRTDTVYPNDTDLCRTCIIGAWFLTRYRTSRCAVPSLNAGSRPIASDSLSTCQQNRPQSSGCTPLPRLLLPGTRSTAPALPLPPGACTFATPVTVLPATTA